MKSLQNSPQLWMLRLRVEQELRRRGVDRKSLTKQRIKPLPSLAQFVRDSWSTFEPGTKLEWNWHHDAICQHLEAVLYHVAQQLWPERIEDAWPNGAPVAPIQFLMINVPPRTSKSIIASVCFPAWCWLAFPEITFICRALNDSLALSDHARKFVALIKSEWYREQLDHCEIVKETPSHVTNNRGGERRANGMRSGATGFGGIITIIDDPHDVRDIFSQAELEAAKAAYRALASRKNNARAQCEVIVCQRVGQNDLCEERLTKEPNKWVRLSIPEIYYTPTTELTANDAPNPLGWIDPRTGQEDALLWSEFRPLEFINSLRRGGNLLALEFEAQYQQRAIALEGQLFRPSFFEIVNADQLPTNLRLHRHWDLAATVEKPGKDPDYTVGLKAGYDSITGYFYIIDIVRKRLAPNDIEQLIKQTAIIDGYGCSITIEQEKASAGIHLMDFYKRKVLQGYTFGGQRLWGDKEERARPVSSYHKPLQGQEHGMIRIVRAAWNPEFFKEAVAFPASTHKDQVDAMSGAFHELITTKATTLNTTQTVKTDYEPVY